MERIVIEMETALGFMDQCFCDWTDACAELHRMPDSTSRLDAANAAHARFLQARNRVLAILREHQEALMEYRAILAGVAGAD